MEVSPLRGGESGPAVAGHEHELARGLGDVGDGSVPGSGELGDAGAGEREAGGDGHGIAAAPGLRIPGRGVHRAVEQHPDEAAAGLADLGHGHVEQCGGVAGLEVEQVGRSVRVAGVPADHDGGPGIEHLHHPDARAELGEPGLN